MLQLVKVSDATTHAQAGRNGTAPYVLFVGVSQSRLVFWFSMTKLQQRDFFWLRVIEIFNIPMAMGLA